MAAIERIVTGVNYTYTGTKITMTTIYFNDGTSLDMDGHWVLEVGNSYRIEYSGVNPVTVTAVTMKLGRN